MAVQGTSVTKYLAGAAGWHVIVGPARSACSTPVALLGGLQGNNLAGYLFINQSGIPSISYWSTSRDLDSTNYPLFGRSCTSDNSNTEAMLAYLKYANWDRLGMIYIKDEWGTVKPL